MNFSLKKNGKIVVNFLHPCLKIYKFFPEKKWKDCCQFLTSECSAAYEMF